MPDARHIVSGPRLPGVPKGALHLRHLLAGDPVEPMGNPGDEALIIFTSGTTDAPKAVVHSRGIPALIGGAPEADEPRGCRALVKYARSQDTDTHRTEDRCR